MTPLSGVRSSWLMLARKSDFAREASIARRSASRRSVMSVPAATMCSISPSGPTRQLLLQAISRGSRSSSSHSTSNSIGKSAGLASRKRAVDGLDVLGRERELGGAEAADLVLEAAGEQLARAVEALDAALGVEDHDQAAGGVDHRGREVALGLDRGLRAQALGHVGRHAEEAGDLAVVVALGGDRQRHRDPPAVLADVRPPLRLGPQGDEHLGPGLDAELVGARRDLLGVVQHLRRRLADDLVGVVAEHALGAAVEDGDRAARVGGDDRGLGRVPEHAGEQVVASCRTRTTSDWMASPVSAATTRKSSALRQDVTG